MGSPDAGKFTPEPESASSIPLDSSQDTGRGRERFLNLLKEALVFGLLAGAALGVLSVIGGAREGVLELSVAAGVTGGAVWIIEPLPGRLAHRLVEHFSQR